MQFCENVDLWVGPAISQSVRPGLGADQRFMREEDWHEDWSLVLRRIRRREKLLVAFEGYETSQHHFLCQLSPNAQYFAQYAQYFALINLIMKLQFGSISSFSLLLILLGDT